MMSWAIWEDRNALLNCGKGSDPGMVVTQVTNRLDEFRNSRKAFSLLAASLVSRAPTDWIAPPPSQLKLNTGVSLRSTASLIGIRVTIRDDRGKVLVAHSNLFYGSFNAELGQFMALREGLMLARFYNFHIQVAEVSSSKVISSLNSPHPILDDARFIVSDIKALLSDVGYVRVFLFPSQETVWQLT
ncbi:hypothetical protein Dsin_025202 [Dipteronia sinensis]|uniref:RNase H type-1 domain-containing protein n=1 Tax=Dipteronia sinensis TaxID=43782 RepID=A0AAE0DWQ9_9ROSI|nr:hypothetical protein Dsin_025202 [Dipteronia sinensis]